MKTVYAALAFIALILISRPVMAQQEGPPRSGKDFLQACSGFSDPIASPGSYAEGLRLGVCAGYVQGVRGALAYTRTSALAESANVANALIPVCIPSEITVGELVIDIVKSLNGRAEQLGKPIETVIEMAFREAFPCGKDTDSNVIASQGRTAP